MINIQVLLIYFHLLFSIVDFSLFPSFIANRSFCHFKLECCGDALRDASKAIELDPNYEKGYIITCFSLYYLDGIAAHPPTIIPVILRILSRISRSAMPLNLLLRNYVFKDLEVVCVGRLKM